MTTTSLSRDKALGWLRELLSTIESVRATPRFSSAHKDWLRDVKSALERTFGPDTHYLSDVRKVRWNAVVWGRGTEDISELSYQNGFEEVAHILKTCIAEIEERWDDTAATAPPTAGPPRTEFINSSRLGELRLIGPSTFDLKRLVRLAEEIDSSFNSGSYYAVAALTRALLDHVPPIFGVTNFAQVASNYPGAKSFRDSMKHLENSARAIGDANLHTQVRTREVLPTSTQVNFSNDLDVLFAEIVRLLG